MARALASFVLAFIATVAASNVAAQTYMFGQASTAGQPSYTSNYNMGYAFSTTQSNVQITHLSAATPDTVARTVYLWDSTSTAAPIAQVTTGTTATVGGWRNAALSSPVSLIANRQYRVSVLTTAYYIIPATGAWAPTGGAVTFVQAYYTPGTTALYPNTAYASQLGVCDIGYTTGPGLTVSATAGTTQSVLATDTGPTSTGRNIGTFTIAANSSGAMTLNSISLTASGTGNDSNAFSEVGIYEDTNTSTAYDTGDVRYGTAATVYPADNGTLTFTAVANFSASQTRRYFVVAKLNGTTLGTNGQTFNTQVSAMAVAGGTASGTPSTVMNGLTITSPALTVAAISAAAQSAYANSTGSGGNGIAAATFTITCNAVGTGNLASISITASGTGDDSTAFSEVAVYEDTDTSTTYTPGTDALYGAASTAFPSDNGVITFTAAQAFSPSTSRRYFVVVKLNGSTLATSSQTFNFQVSAIGVTGTTGSAGTPSAVMTGVTIQAPSFTFADASAATAGTAYPSSGDFVMQKFTAAYPAGPNNTLTGVTLTAGGSGNDATGYASVRLVRDSNANGTYEPASDTQVATMAAFAADNGTVTFTLSDAFTAGLTNTYFVVSAYNASVTAGNTFQCRVSGAAYGYSGTTATGIPAPASLTAGLTIAVPSFTITDASSATQGTAYLGGTDYVIQSFTVAYPSGPANTITSMTLTASGTGNDLNDYASVRLFRDSNSSTSYEVGVDAQVATQPSFTSNNGTCTFTLAGTESQFAAATTKRYFIVVAYNLNGTNNSTFSTQLTACGGLLYGATLATLPSPATGGTAGLLLLANNLVATLNGPTAAATVNNGDQGAGGIGLVVCDVSMTTVNAAWTATTMTFTASGNGNDALAYNYLALHEDLNANGTYDGPAGGDQPAVASAAVAFPINDGDYVATLTNTAFTTGSTRRFFLIGKLAGTAISGQAFNASLTAVSATGPSGGQLTGVPTAASTALFIGTTALTVANSPTAPASTAREGGLAFGHTLAMYRFTASNNSVVVNGVTLTAQGNGSWVTHVAATNGVQLYADNGNGTYDGAPTDTLLYSGAGNTPSMTCTFSTPLNILNGQTKDVFVRINLLATAGGSLPETFRSAIAATTDVNATGATVLLGTPVPTSGTLSVVIFNVTSFSPAYDQMAGGSPITITGSGFLAPLTMTIGGFVVPGSPVINATGTQITGFTVPAGSGQNLTIVLTNGALGPKTLTQTFGYAAGSTIGSGTGSGGGGGGGCVAEQSNAIGLLGLAALLVMILGLRVAKRQVG